MLFLNRSGDFALKISQTQFSLVCPKPSVRKYVSPPDVLLKPAVDFGFSAIGCPFLNLFLADFNSVFSLQPLKKALYCPCACSYFTLCHVLHFVKEVAAN